MKAPRTCRSGSGMRSFSWPPTKCFMWTDLYSLTSTCCDPQPGGLMISRRQMLGRMCAGFGLLGLAGLAGTSSAVAGAVPRLPHFTPKAKRVVFLFMNGGPSHVDTFDPKPALLAHEGEQPSGELYKKSKGTGFMPSPL